jgi:hypothetical protein
MRGMKHEPKRMAREVSQAMPKSVEGPLAMLV